MMSTKIDSQRLLLKNPFSDSLTPFKSYQFELEANIQILRKKYPHEEVNKMQDLL
jgi:hypothetical protein